MAVAVGHAHIYSLWELPDTKVVVLLRGDNYKIALAWSMQARHLRKKLKFRHFF
jgi:hypothetical protein